MKSKNIPIVDSDSEEEYEEKFSAEYEEIYKF